MVAAKLHTTAKLGSDARESLLYHLDGKVDRVHIAAHGGYYPGNPPSSAIFLAADGENDGRLEAGEILAGVNLAGVNLVVLSACQSGVGKRSGGDDVLGLTRSLLYAGTPAVISTLWTIHDAATVPLMKQFYDRLLSGTPPAAALREAQLQLLASRQYADPHYWAAFFLTGNPHSCCAARRGNFVDTSSASTANAAP